MFLPAIEPRIVHPVPIALHSVALVVQFARFGQNDEVNTYVVFRHSYIRTELTEGV